MCTEVRDDGDLAVEYEFPCYNKTSQDSVSWEREPGQWSVYGGVMLRAVTGMGSVLWPRIQTMLRRSVSRKQEKDSSRLVQWRKGMAPSQVTVKIRGPEGRTLGSHTYAGKKSLELSSLHLHCILHCRA